MAVRAFTFSNIVDRDVSSDVQSLQAALTAESSCFQQALLLHKHQGREDGGCTSIYLNSDLSILFTITGSIG